jgi:hypothetical protein
MMHCNKWLDRIRLFLLLSVFPKKEKGSLQATPNE